jgi:hypothetical protein
MKISEQRTEYELKMNTPDMRKFSIDHPCACLMFNRHNNVIAGEVKMTNDPSVFRHSKKKMQSSFES